MGEEGRSPPHLTPNDRLVRQMKHDYYRQVWLSEGSVGLEVTPTWAGSILNGS